MRIPDEILEYHNRTTPEQFINDVIDTLFILETDKYKAQLHIRGFYQNNTLDIRWFKDLEELDSYAATNNLSDLDLVLSYTNINLIYFYHTMLKMLTTTEYSDLVNPTLLEIYSKNQPSAYHAYHALLETFGIAPVYKDGEVVEVLCVEKPINLSISTTNILHNNQGPALQIGKTKIYALHNVLLDETTWKRTIKTINQDTELNLTNVRPFTTNEILNLEPVELKTAIIQEIGYDALHLPE